MALAPSGALLFIADFNNRVVRLLPLGVEAAAATAAEPGHNDTLPPHAQPHLLPQHPAGVSTLHLRQNEFGAFGVGARRNMEGSEAEAEPHAFSLSHKPAGVAATSDGRGLLCVDEDNDRVTLLWLDDGTGKRLPQPDGM